MNRSFPAPAASLFQRESRVIKPALVEKFGRAISPACPCQRRDCVDHQAFVPDLLFRPLPVLDVGVAAKPLDDIPLLIKLGNHTDEKPSILSVITPNARF